MIFDYLKREENSCGTAHGDEFFGVNIYAGREMYIEYIYGNIRRCIQKFPDWPPEARAANGTALSHCAVVSL
jgi:hypothetical protein